MSALANCEDASACMARFVEAAEAAEALAALAEADCLAIMSEAVDRGNVALAQVRRRAAAGSPLTRMPAQSCTVLPIYTPVATPPS